MRKLRAVASRHPLRRSLRQRILSSPALSLRRRLEALLSAERELHIQLGIKMGPSIMREHFSWIDSNCKGLLVSSLSD